MEHSANLRFAIEFCFAKLYGKPKAYQHPRQIIFLFEKMKAHYPLDNVQQRKTLSKGKKKENKIVWFDFIVEKDDIAKRIG